MPSMLRTLAAAATLALAIGLAAPADAAQRPAVVALTGDRTLLVLGDDLRRGVIRRVNVKASARVAGIDVRPADKRLYALLDSGQIVTVNITTGAVTARSRLSVAVPTGTVSIDFNPVVDRLRVVSSTGANLRVDVDTGAATADPALNFAQPNPLGGATPGIVAIAYSNSVAGTRTTQLYDLDAPTNGLYLQLPPNNGTLNAVGATTRGVDIAATGFDITTDIGGRNRGWVSNRGSILEIDLAGGAIVSRTSIPGAGSALRDLAGLIR